jgi:O-antigen/teichoic acid export membrane protein
MSFAAMIVIARSANAAELGFYSIATSAVVMMVTVQDSLVTRPYSIQIFKPCGTPAEHGMSALVHSLLLAAAAFFVAVAAAMLFYIPFANSFAAIMALAIAAAAPGILLREFGRRYSLANLRMYRAFAVDVIAAGLTLTIMLALGLTGRLTAVTAMLAIGFGAGVSGVAWFVRRREAFSFNRDSVRQTLTQSWALGKWLLCSQVAMQAQGYTVHWLCLVMLGAQATGTYAACLSVVALANPFLYGFFNMLTPKSVRTLKNQGAAELRRQVWRDSLLLGGLMSCFTILIYFFGETLMELLYAGGDFADRGQVLLVLSLASIASAVGAFGGPAAIALQSAERGRAIATMAGLTLATGVISTAVLVWNFSLIGAAWGLLVTEVAGAMGRWVLFMRLGVIRPPIPERSPE